MGLRRRLNAKSKMPRLFKRKFRRKYYRTYMRFYKGFRKDLRSRYIYAFIHYYHFGLQSTSPLLNLYALNQSKSVMESDVKDFTILTKDATSFIPKTR